MMKEVFCLIQKDLSSICIQEGRQLDLGAVGKGYALDRLKKMFESVAISSALLCAGNSTY